MASLDKAHFERLFRTEISRLHNFAKQYVQDSDTAMDICQQVFITLWEKREQIDMAKAVRTYLYTSVRNRCLNHIRDHKKFRSKVLDLDCGNIDIEGFTEIEQDTAELETKIDDALTLLPEKCRQVFEMSRFREMKYREIAEELDISQKTVEAHMSKAMRILREALQEYRMGLWYMLYFFISGS